MTIFSNKLSSVSTQVPLDVDPSDTIEGIKSKLIVAEDNPLFNDISKVRLFFGSFGSDNELIDSHTLSDYDIHKDNVLSAVYTANVTVYGVDGASGLYNIWGWDPGGFYVYNKVVGEDTYSLIFDNDTSDRWAIKLNFDTVVAATTHNVRSAHAFTPYNESAFVANDSPVWLNNVFVCEGTSDCRTSSCDPRYDRFATETEDGCNRHRRLWVLGFNV